MYKTYPELVELAAETLNIIKEGKYKAEDTIERFIANRVHASVMGTVMLEPKTMIKSLPTPHKEHKPIIQVTTEATISALQRLSSPKSQEVLGCLNFASAKNPGGGFLKGTMAQEEALAYSSSLYPSLMTQPAYYEHHKKLLAEKQPPLYTDRVIWSPDVVFFRGNNKRLLYDPICATVLTCAAPKMVEIKENFPEAEYLVPEVLAARIEGIFRAAIYANIRYFVVGAWGCGVFGNDPILMALMFQQAITKYGNYFEHIVFAIYGCVEDENYVAFNNILYRND